MDVPMVDEVPDIILPDEVLDEILRYLDVRSILAAAQVNRRWSSLAKAVPVVPQIQALLGHRAVREFVVNANQPDPNVRLLKKIYMDFTTEIVDSFPDRAARDHVFSSWCGNSLSRAMAPIDDAAAVERLIGTHADAALSTAIVVGRVPSTLRVALLVRACMSTFILRLPGGDRALGKPVLLGASGSR